MMLSLFPNTPSSECSHLLRWLISIAATSEIVLPSILKYLVSLLSLVPLQTGQTIFSFMSPARPGYETISEESPSPTLKSSSEPYTIRSTISSGRSSIGSYSENAYFLDMERIMSNFLVSRILPRGTTPPSAIEMDLSGMTESMFISTI